MKKFMVGALVGFGVIVGAATPASAVGWYYSGYWYNTSGECEAGYQRLVAGKDFDLPHECRLDAVGVYELWRVGL
jgi:hypothetical protein